MDWIIKYFNITNDIDLIWLVIKAISSCVFLMVLYRFLPIIKRIFISFFSFSKPKIITWLVQVENTTNGKKVHLAWNVSGSIDISIDPIYNKNNFSKVFKIYIGGIYAFFILLFKYKNYKSKYDILVKKNRFKNFKLLNHKFTLPQGSYSFYLEQDNLEITLNIRGVWGENKSSVLISNPSIENRTEENKSLKENFEFPKEFNNLIYSELLRKYTLSYSNSNKDILKEIYSNKFKEKNIVTTGNKLQKIYNKYNSSFKSTCYTSLKPNRIHLPSNIIFNNFTNEFLNFREYNKNNNQFE